MLSSARLTMAPAPGPREPGRGAPAWEAPDWKPWPPAWLVGGKDMAYLV
jgi:hypothetical protein